MIAARRPQHTQRQCKRCEIIMLDGGVCVCIARARARRARAQRFERLKERLALPAAIVVGVAAGVALVAVLAWGGWR